MEIIIGMIIAFLVGAYVRKPFAIAKKEVVPPMPEKSEDEAKENKKLQAQLQNLMAYNGEKQEEID